MLHVFDKRMSHKTEFYKICSMTRNSWLEVIFAVYFLNTLIFYHNLDGMQKIRESYKELCKNQKLRLKRQLSSGGYSIIHSPWTIIKETLNSHFHTNTFEKNYFLTLHMFVQPTKIIFQNQ